MQQNKFLTGVQNETLFWGTFSLINNEAKYRQQTFFQISFN